MPVIHNGFARYDTNDLDDLQVLITSGMIWKGGPKSVGKALRALRSGAVSRPTEKQAPLPPEVVEWLDRQG
jgi:hypothetical protein